MEEEAVVVWSKSTRASQQLSGVDFFHELPFYLTENGVQSDV